VFHKHGGIGGGFKSHVGSNEGCHAQGQECGELHFVGGGGIVGSM